MDTSFASVLSEVKETLNTLDVLRASGWQNLVPPNYQGKSTLFTSAFALALQQGIPIVWLPRQDTLEALLMANTENEYGATIEACAESIMVDCDDILMTITVERAVPYSRFAGQAIKALRGGHSAVAQALAINTLESVLHEWYPAKSNYVRVIKGITRMQEKWVSNQKTEGKKVVDDWSAGVSPGIIAEQHHYLLALVGVPVWWAYRRWSGRNAPGDTKLSRHISAHAVWDSQYSPSNAVKSVMVLTSTIKALTELGSVYDDEIDD
ncbi:MAG: hypothetical protein LBV00_08165 [Propionibacteriaceae bacterium]|jgi:hypothetical protein|nr:hypothetical protein [Propionibacteriaceae bacterium]